MEKMIEMLNTNDVNRILQNLVNDSLNNEDMVGLSKDIVRPYLNNINDLDFKRFIIYSLENVSDTFNMQLMICLSSSFKLLSVKDYVEMFESLVLAVNRYTLVEFICKYLDVDGLGLFSISSIDNSEKVKLFQFFERNKELLFRSELDYQDLNSNLYGVTKEDLIEINTFLVGEFKFQKMIENDKILDYINQRIIQFSN